MEEELYELIDRYVTGEMSPEEAAAFDVRLKSDVDLAKRVALYKSVSANLSSRIKGKEKRERFRENLSTIEADYFNQASGNSSNTKKWYLWAAAACITLLCGVFMYNQFTSRPAYSDYAIYEPLALMERGSEDSLKQTAQQTFNSGNYAEAIQQFDRLLQVEPKNTEVRFYKGIALVELDRFNEAEGIFTEIKNSQSVLSDKAIWFLALSALKQKDYKKCEKFLGEIEPESEEYKKAQELLDEL